MVVPAQNVSMWYRMTAMQVARELHVDPAQGLSTAEAAARLKRYGPNLLATERKSLEPKQWAHLYWLIIPAILFVATLFSILFSTNLIGTLVLMGLTILSLFLGIYPEVEAGRHGAAHQQQTVRVRRSGQVVEVDAAEVVPGDIVVMTTGDRVPADGRLYIAARLQIDESALDGGSISSRKEIGVLENVDYGFGAQTNMAFMQTTVTNGYGAMIVTGTGLNTEIGRSIAQRDHTLCSQAPNDQALREQEEKGTELMPQQQMPINFTTYAVAMKL